MAQPEQAIVLPIKNKSVMWMLLTIALLFTLTGTHAVDTCRKCDIKKVKVVHDNINVLTYGMIKDFLCTFDATCSNNAEFSAFSNEMLFKVIEQSPGLFLKVLHKENMDNIPIILSEIRNPIQGGFKLKDLYEKVKGVSSHKAYKDKILEALKVAADKQKVEIK